MDLPSEIATQLAGYARASFGRGESGAEVWHCTAHGLPSRYLKVAALDAGLRLREEAERLHWMRDQAIPVPTVLSYHHSGNAEYLLLDEVRGLPASDAKWLSALSETTGTLGRGLARLHETSIEDCPFDQRIATQIVEARHRIDTGRVAAEDFDDVRLGRAPDELFGELLATVPASEDLVLTHGDFCLPNIILDRRSGEGIVVSGLVDCARAGVADRHQDLALAIRSIRGTFGAEWVAPFIRAYGRSSIDEAKIDFYLLLDEYF